MILLFLQMLYSTPIWEPDPDWPCECEDGELTDYCVEKYEENRKKRGITDDD